MIQGLHTRFSFIDAMRVLKEIYSEIDTYPCIIRNDYHIRMDILIHFQELGVVDFTFKQKDIKINSIDLDRLEDVRVKEDIDRVERKNRSEAFGKTTLTRDIVIQAYQLQENQLIQEDISNQLGISIDRIQSILRGNYNYLMDNEDLENINTNYRVMNVGKLSKETVVSIKKLIYKSYPLYKIRDILNINYYSLKKVSMGEYDKYFNFDEFEEEQLILETLLIDYDGYKALLKDIKEDVKIMRAGSVRVSKDLVLQVKKLREENNTYERIKEITKSSKSVLYRIVKGDYDYLLNEDMEFYINKYKSEKAAKDPKILKEEDSRVMRDIEKFLDKKDLPLNPPKLDNVFYNVNPEDGLIRIKYSKDIKESFNIDFSNFKGNEFEIKIKGKNIEIKM